MNWNYCRQLTSKFAFGIYIHLPWLWLFGFRKLLCTDGDRMWQVHVGPVCVTLEHRP